MNVSNIIVTNRTKSKADELKKLFKNIKIVEWGDIPDFDMIINATSLGLKNEEINLDFSKIKNDKFFYDVIYNPNETNFLRNAKKAGNYTENGKKMFIYQAAEAFRIWHGIQPEINNEVFENFRLMKRIGILGDIGSGKSHIAKKFGYPVFNADQEVAKLYKKDKIIFKKLKKNFTKIFK